MGDHAEMSNSFSCEHLFPPQNSICMCQTALLSYAAYDCVASVFEIKVPPACIAALDRRQKSFGYQRGLLFFLTFFKGSNTARAVCNAGSVSSREGEKEMEVKGREEKGEIDKMASGDRELCGIEKTEREKSGSGKDSEKEIGHNPKIGGSGRWSEKEEGVEIKREQRDK